MKRFALLIAVLTGLLASGCGGSATRSAADFTVEIYTPEYASGFDIRGRDKDAATLVTVRNPWQGAGNVEQHLLILREGAKAPAGLDAQVVKAPVRHVVCMSSSHVAMFDALGEVRRISGVSGIDYISNTYVNEHRYCGEVRDVGYDTNLNFELEGKLSSFPAKVYATESRIDQSTRTLTVRALYANSNGALLPGRYASIQLKKEEIPNAIAIPSEAIVPEMGKDKVFLYKSGKAEPVEITAGIRTEAEVQVIKGLQMGDTIITSGTLQLRTGLPVTLDNIN